MLSLLLGAAALATVLVVGLRLWRDRSVERRRPGGSPGSAIPIHDYSDIDVAVRLETCRCGGRFSPRGEGPTTDGQRPLRFVHLECSRCERERKLFFDLTTLRH